jgi:hypothetical protein
MSGAVVQFKAGAPLSAIVPASFEDVQRMARMAVTAGLFKGERKDTQEALLGKATMAIMQGLEVGLPPMQAIQQIAVINGRCVIWGDAVPALLWAHGFKIKEWIDARVAYCTVTRPDGEHITRQFSEADARKARLWDERQTVTKTWDGKQEQKPNDSPWFRFPDRMLQMRARGFAVRDGAPDVLRGIYIREEIDEPRAIEAAPQIDAAVLELPDIPDEPPADVNAVLREIERALQHMTPEGVHYQFSTAIMAMDEDSRAAALEMIEAAKAG